MTFATAIRLAMSGRIQPETVGFVESALSPPTLLGGRCESARVTVIAPAARCWKVDVMGRNRTNRIVRRIECGLLIVAVTCLLWVGATSLSAFLYHMANVSESSYETVNREGNTS
jgi:hypothetical protein